MRVRALKALVTGIHAWNSPVQVGSHALARGLAERGWQVAYVSAPLTPFHWLLRHRADIPERWAWHRQGVQQDAGSGVWHYVPFGLIAPDHRPGLNARWVFEHWHRFSLPNVAKALSAKGFGDVDLLVLNSHFQPFWLDAITHRRSVYRLADLTSGFPGCGASAQAVEAEIVRRVDLVVTAAHGLTEVVAGMGARSVMAMPNGIRSRSFEDTGAPSPLEYRSWSGPIAVYVGAFGPWIDQALIRSCAISRPDVNFVLIGPREGVGAPLHDMPNVHLLGAMPREQLVPYLRHAHVGLMPFDRVACPDLVDHVHPLKLYEYLACGLPVISTEWAELGLFPHPATVCATEAQFIDALPVKAMLAPGAAERERFARAADWEFRISGLIDRLDLPRTGAESP